MSSKQPQAAISILYGFVVNVISGLRPYAPQLVPILVFAIFVPLAILLSAFAGYIVWTNLSVSWEFPLYFQYGYVFLFYLCVAVLIVFGAMVCRLMRNSFYRPWSPLSVMTYPSTCYSPRPNQIWLLETS
jgi:hypothetical protein